jgi:hypothetical protein
MKFIIKMWGAPQFTIEIRLFDGFDKGGTNVYTCKVNNTTFYFESNADDEIWQVLDNAILALKKFREKEVS